VGRADEPGFPDVFFTGVRYDLHKGENDEDEEFNEEEEWADDDTKVWERCRLKNNYRNVGNIFGRRRLMS
jgi:hypothetical protein